MKTSSISKNPLGKIGWGEESYLPLFKSLAHAFADPQPGLPTYKPIYEGRNLILQLAVVSVVAKMRASADFDLKV